MLASDGTTWEQQSSAFTEALKTNYNNYNTTLTTQATQITALQTKTQNISNANSTNTIMNKPLQIDNNGE